MPTERPLSVDDRAPAIERCHLSHGQEGQDAKNEPDLQHDNDAPEEKPTTPRGCLRAKTHKLCGCGRDSRKSSPRIPRQRLIQQNAKNFSRARCVSYDCQVAPHALPTAAERQRDGRTNHSFRGNVSKEGKKGHRAIFVVCREAPVVSSDLTVSVV